MEPTVASTRTSDVSVNRVVAGTTVSGVEGALDGGVEVVVAAASVTFVGAVVFVGAVTLVGAVVLVVAGSGGVGDVAGWGVFVGAGPLSVGDAERSERVGADGRVLVVVDRPARGAVVRVGNDSAATSGRKDDARSDAGSDWSSGIDVMDPSVAEEPVDVDGTSTKEVEVEVGAVELGEADVSVTAGAESSTIVGV